RDYYEENVDVIREKKRNHRRAHPELYAGADKAKFAKRRTRETQAGGSYTKQEWQELCIKYSYRCLCCGKQEPEIKLVADHVIPVTQMGTSNIDNIQPLCGSCNSKKHNKFIDYRR
ncbi:MAG: HNH endonuclease, partial [Chloroflexi bacterium]